MGSADSVFRDWKIVKTCKYVSSEQTRMEFKIFFRFILSSFDYVVGRFSFCFFFASGDRISIKYRWVVARAYCALEISFTSLFGWLWNTTEAIHFWILVWCLHDTTPTMYHFYKRKDLFFSSSFSISFFIFFHTGTAYSALIGTTVPIHFISFLSYASFSQLRQRDFKRCFIFRLEWKSEYS